MYFNSYIFIFLFVPLTVAGYFALDHFGKKRIGQAWLVLMSLCFYSYGTPWLFFLITASMAGNYIFSILMKHFRHPRLFGTLGVVFDLGLLFYFKYFDFFISNVNAFFNAGWELKHIILPMGISFYTFQQISYIVDRARGKAEHYALLDYMIFVTFFPQLVAGPIVRHNELVPQFRDAAKKSLNWENLTKGSVLFVLGLSKKILLADMLSLIADQGYGDIAALDSPGALLTMLAYTFQIYFDFSAYSDMALGLGLMMNISLPHNFDQPYRSRSIREFWRRWHITLGQFLAEYVYIPLGGNRKGKPRRALNTLILFFLSGLWHGAAWNFVLWGLCHGIVIAFEDLFEAPLKKLEASKPGRFLRWLGAFVIINFSWVLFRVSSLKQVPQFFGRLFSFSENGSVSVLAQAADNAFLFIPVQLAKKLLGEHYFYVYFVFVLLLLLVSAVLAGRKEAWAYTEKGVFKKKMILPLAVLFFLSVISLSKVVVFLYSNF
jgi:D-alanyl-lipoteichoic acid acyltransferase DltB (MBOAT superfamily)